MSTKDMTVSQKEHQTGLKAEPKAAPDQIVTRFAPSPTGFLHIGGARTALFNYLYARRFGGKYLLRVEDTDRERSTQAAVDAILNGLEWLGLDADEPPVFQSKNIERHQQVAQELLDKGLAYQCYTSVEELTQLREDAREKGDNFHFQSPWREADAKDCPDDGEPVVRLKMQQDGQTKITDLVQGEITIDNDQLDDMILLRADGTPTYMLSVVVDDHDMGITHVVRGDDHLTNTFRQAQLYQAMGWPLPQFAHLPLIHGADGAKLSKRHGSLSVEEYRDNGFLPEALVNYLMRLGWSHGDEEIIALAQAEEWFDLAQVGKSPARFDLEKLEFLNGHYLRARNNLVLLELVAPVVEAQIGRALSDEERNRYLAIMDELKERAQTLPELAHAGLFCTYGDGDVPRDEAATALLAETDAALLSEIKAVLEAATDWQHEALFEVVKQFAKDKGLKVGQVAQVIRAQVTGTTKGASMFKILEALGRGEVLRRL